MSLVVSWQGMNICELHCQEPWFSYLREGKKTVEGRLNDQECDSIRKGDEIELYNDKQRFRLTVTKVKKFATLTEYLETVGLKAALPGIKTIDEGRKIYLQFYTEEQIEQYGMLAFWVQKT